MEAPELTYTQGNDPYDPLTDNKFTMNGSLVSRTRNWRMNDISDVAEQKYSAVYDVRVFLWVRTPQDPQGKWMEPSYDTALRLRDDMLAITRSCLLTTPSLGSGGAARVNEGTMAEDYLDAFKSGDQNPRWMAGGTISFELNVAEQNYKEKIGNANTFIIDSDSITGE